MTSLIPTIVALKLALSRIPFTRIAVRISVITIAGRSSVVPVEMMRPTAGS